MKKRLLIGLLSAVFLNGQVHAHCQMPCGIYHDELVYNQIDQYAETMYKAVAVLNDLHMDNVKEKNDFVRWVVQKENASNEIADVICKYFLMQKIKPGEEDTARKLAEAHKLLFGIVQIKQNTDIKFVEAFTEDWEKFKLMFHVEGYECKIDMLRIKKREAERKRLEEQENKEANTKPAAPAVAPVK